MKYGVIGEHLPHSFSKEIHERIGDYNYIIKEVSKEALPSFLKEHDFNAINVTIPYKETVIPYLYYISPNAKAINAVNTVVNKDGKLYGYNTDFHGMKALILKNGFDLENKRVLILGAGGTSKTSYAVCEDLHAKEIVKVSREPIGKEISYQDAVLKYNDVDFIINTTPCGMYPNNDDLIIDLDKFTNLKGVVDAVYNPLRTTLVESATSRGIKAIGGLYMLIAQAVYACEIFMDTKLDHSIIDKIYQDMVYQKENVVLIGMPSSGKSTIGKSVALKLNKEYIDIDEEIIKVINCPIENYIKEFGEVKFRDIEEEVIKEFAKKCGYVIATGGGAILKEENINRLKQNGKIFFIDRNLDLLTPTKDRPLSSDKESLKKRYKERIKLYNKYKDIKVSNNGEIIDAVNAIIKEVSK